MASAAGATKAKHSQLSLSALLVKLKKEGTGCIEDFVRTNCSATNFAEQLKDLFSNFKDDGEDEDAYSLSYIVSKTLYYMTKVFRAELDDDLKSKGKRSQRFVIDNRWSPAFYVCLTLANKITGLNLTKIMDGETQTEKNARLSLLLYKSIEFRCPHSSCSKSKGLESTKFEHNDYKEILQQLFKDKAVTFDFDLNVSAAVKLEELLVAGLDFKDFFCFFLLVKVNDIALPDEFLARLRHFLCLMAYPDSPVYDAKIHYLISNKYLSFHDMQFSNGANLEEFSVKQVKGSKLRQILAAEMSTDCCELMGEMNSSSFRSESIELIHSGGDYFKGESCYVSFLRIIALLERANDGSWQPAISAADALGCLIGLLQISNFTPSSGHVLVASLYKASTVEENTENPQELVLSVLLSFFNASLIFNEHFASLQILRAILTLPFDKLTKINPLKLVFGKFHHDEKVFYLLSIFRVHHLIRADKLRLLSYFDTAGKSVHDFPGFSVLKARLQQQLDVVKPTRHADAKLRKRPAHKKTKPTANKTLLNIYKAVKNSSSAGEVSSLICNCLSNANICLFAINKDDYLLVVSNVKAGAARNLRHRFLDSYTAGSVSIEYADREKKWLLRLTKQGYSIWVAHVEANVRAIKKREQVKRTSSIRVASLVKMAVPSKSKPCNPRERKPSKKDQQRAAYELSQKRKKQAKARKLSKRNAYESKASSTPVMQSSVATRKARAVGGAGVGVGYKARQQFNARAAGGAGAGAGAGVANQPRQQFDLEDYVPVLSSIKPGVFNVAGIVRSDGVTMTLLPKESLITR